VQLVLVSHCRVRVRHCPRRPRGRVTTTAWTTCGGAAARRGEVPFRQRA
jgi:hypothetical protein